MMVNDEKNLDNLNRELAGVVAQQQAKPKAKRAPAKRAGPARKKPNVIITMARRKTSIARASLAPGMERVTVNRVDIKAIKPRLMRELILEPINVSGATREIASGSDISITVRGGGVSGQAQAARSAIAKAIAKAAPDDSVRKEYYAYDRAMMVDDVRRVEPKKYKGPKARARFQKSYR
jgi:small subunit ribosomal protein S9